MESSVGIQMIKWRKIVSEKKKCHAQVWLDPNCCFSRHTCVCSLMSVSESWFNRVTVSDGLFSLITKHWRESRPLLSSGFNGCDSHAHRIMALTCCQSEWQLMNSNWRSSHKIQPSFVPSVLDPFVSVEHIHFPAADPDPAALCAQRGPVSLQIVSLWESLRIHVFVVEPGWHSF